MQKLDGEIEKMPDCPGLKTNINYLSIPTAFLTAQSTVLLPLSVVDNLKEMSRCFDLILS